MKKLTFPIAIELGDDEHAFSIVVPDLPGCFSAGDTLEESFVMAREAIESHISVLIDEGMEVPKPRPMSEHLSSAEYSDNHWRWGYVEVDNIPELKKTVRINISLPEILVKDIDAYADTLHLTRSGFLAKAAMEVMSR